MSAEENFVKTLGEYFDQSIPFPMTVGGWGECSLFVCAPEKVKKMFGVTVKNSYWIYVLNGGLVAICTALSTKYGRNDIEFINNYQRNFRNHPRGDVEFSFMQKEISFWGESSEFVPFIYVYARNILEGYNVSLHSPCSNRTAILKQLYTPMFHQWIEYIEIISNEITTPYTR